MALAALAECFSAFAQSSLKTYSSLGSSDDVEILILGSGWTGTFLIPLLKENGVSFAATSRSGSGGTIKFSFDLNAERPDAFEVLPNATTVVIVFPIYEQGGSEKLTKSYLETHPESSPLFVQLGSTGIWNRSIWYDRHSPYNPTNKRALAEDELLALHPRAKATVLELCGLWGGSRSMRNYVDRVAPTKEALKARGSIHLIHGLDVARAILAVHNEPKKAVNNRWLVTDGRVYDWWDLASAWGTGGADGKDKPLRGPQPGWVRELMDEEGIGALPRTPEQLGNALDSREFWNTFNLSPAKARVE
ncbi:hypothetical protein SISSUDRAFT_990071 [Sistotremastrum suecicum HHB10207 ss-3]|uniref:NAD(P)-binding protein n=1 Tax=Sistotremastrum suecicum HHB10207 ss-3 TaxID=1314776 RepID=A0A166AWX0_9AGAM|nr:hypothetical protein SISSUDRAFT_990071 [Sistotremastrum suecicum HHB10207 ss-3]